MQYFGADGLGSVRQIFDASAQVVGSSRYDPYGNVMSHSGATSVFAFAGEQYDAATGLEYLRARYYSAAQGRFTTRDVWPGDDQRPLTLNGWSYVEDSPINRLDPLGAFSVDLIVRSLGMDSRTVEEVFGEKQFGYARWGLYHLLEDAVEGDVISPLTIEQGQNSKTYRTGEGTYGTLSNPAPLFRSPLYLSSIGAYTIGSDGCQLLFESVGWIGDREARPAGPYSLAEFVDKLNESGRQQWLVPWRGATTANHYYARNRDPLYSDFGHSVVLPDFKTVSGTIPVVGFAGITGSGIIDRFGNRYAVLSVSGGPAFDFADYLEGYVDGPEYSDEPALKKIAEGMQYSIASGFGGEVMVSVSPNVGKKTVWFGAGVMVGLSGTWSLKTVPISPDNSSSWDWVDHIRGYDSPE